MAEGPIDFNVNTFEQDWEAADSGQKDHLIRLAQELAPSQGILPVLAGLDAQHYSFRNLARESLAAVKIKLDEMLDARYRQPEPAALQESVLTAGKIYARITTGISLADINFYFKTLLEIGGHGPYYAFKLLYKGDLSTAVLKKIMHTIPDAGKLAFVEQYIQSRPAIRIKFGFEFKNILGTVKSRKAVIAFYAFLFDMKRDADPFLNNLSYSLRDPDQLERMELVSKNADTRVNAVKALSMLTTRVDSGTLAGILEDEPEMPVRIAAYNVIEDSSQGTYADLFPQLMQLVLTKDRNEALPAFRALVVSSRGPLYPVVEAVKAGRPELMQDILEEIARLSRISFFFIQDMALHKTPYVQAHFDINMACILGLLKKRPERIVSIFKTYETNSSDALRMEAIDLIEKTKELLSKEKTNIESEFDIYLQRIKKHRLKIQKQRQGVFTTARVQKIKNMFQKPADKDPVLHPDGLAGQDLSGREFTGPFLFYNRKIVENTSFCESLFSGVFFKQTLFYKVDMSRARFESVCFDNAVFIDVNAQEAVFDDCSFQGAQMYNCNFNHASMVDVCLAACVLSNDSFVNTDFSHAVFAYARISAVSFVNSNLNQADFTGVRARFSRFPPSSDNVYRSDHIDYNARQFQLEIADIPELNQGLADQINMLIFMEFIHYGELKFLKQNKLSLLTAFDIFKPRQADLFEIMPLLIHENLEFAGSGPIDPATPSGISGFLPSIETQKRAARYLGTQAVVVRRNLDSLIEGVFTIGSTGSLAQTIHSDIDYWICVFENRFSPGDMKLLQQKLQKLEQFALSEFQTKVTFFIVDIPRAKHNDFGDSTLESSGSAQSRILKEEFYRTMIYVAGKIPLWSVLPNSISVHYYDMILNRIMLDKPVARYIDLGDIHAISSREYFGASIWQMFKWLQSPFKSVLKMALLEKYLFEYGKKPLLCNKYKDEWMNSGAHLRLAQNDSYIILLENLLDYFQQIDDKVSKNIILTCFFLKLGISRDSDIENTVFGLRKILLKRCMDKWGWDKSKIFEIGSFKTWEYRNIARLSSTIKQYMVKKYKTVNQAIDRQSQKTASISPEDRTILTRKIYIEFSRQEGKVGKELLVSRSDSHFQGLYVTFVKGTNSEEGHWELHNRPARGKEEFLIQAAKLEEIGAWLINNKLYTRTTVVNMMPNVSCVTFNDIKKLFQAMHDFFTPVLAREQAMDTLLKPQTIQNLFVSINFYTARQMERVIHYTAIFYNSWGEMFCKSHDSGTGFDSMADFKQDLKSRLLVETLPKNSVYYFSKRLIR